MDLTIKEQNGKMFKQLEVARKTLGPNNLKNLKKVVPQKQPTLSEVLSMKDANAKPLSYNVDLKRITQLFGRPLQMKYYIVRPPKKPTTANVETKQRMQIINEEGEIINNG